MQKKLDIKRITHQAAMIVFICIFVLSSAMLIKRIYGYWHDNQQYKELRAMLDKKTAPASSISKPATNSTELPTISIPSATPAPINSSNISEITPKAQLPYITEYGNPLEIEASGCLSDYSPLKKKNNDLAGWLQMPGFGKLLDYPVMQAKDNNYYLQRDFYKNPSNAGSIFFDSRNDVRQVERNLIIYGHAMRDFSMLGNLKEYPDKPALHQKLTKIYLDLLEKRLEYEVFSTYHENQDYNYRQIDFADDNEYLSFLNKICAKSVYDYGVVLSPQDRIITLSTCTNIDWNKRTILHARLIKQTIYDNASESAAAAAYKPTNKKAVSANVYLEQLSLQYKTAEVLSEAVFTPVFDTAKKEFSAELPLEAENLSLIIKTADPEAKYEVNLNGKKADHLHLKPTTGQNVIKVRVISRDGLYARTYTINLHY